MSEPVKYCACGNPECERCRLIAEIDGAIESLDPEMMRYQIVQLRERLIRFRASLNEQRVEDMDTGCKALERLLRIGCKIHADSRGGCRCRKI